MLFKKKEICGRYYTENALLSGEKLSTFRLKWFEKRSSENQSWVFRRPLGIFSFKD
ncbi:hypothetical protein NEIMUCOT_05782 [Neisseria mucosa ATCC 25996]|uniref:Uncharacterized protein n=1 Tax=Neisseria mucosa (strain ATCC 25996 / DSM 4631 / NCTC 10774 / M26) TaxID=546266 RepID=D2ZYR7_NEIM2|nr:hypothetical protein [Neisseria sicca]EFC87709.1 hypothetical protein NEIMUCOT_05782 [Neisseria mucosa ATCC 25996]